MFSVEMNLFGIEISHYTASVARREKFSFDDDRIDQAYKRFDTQRREIADSHAELAILSTCNRTEVFGAFPSQIKSETALGILTQVIADGAGVSAETILPHARAHHADAAATHLLRVASGLESQVLGEPQILGQVTKAHELAIQHRSHGPMLKPLFLSAIRAGKRARSETGISRNASSVGSVAVRLASKELGDLSNANIVLLGAGAMGITVLKALRGRKTGSIALLNRTEQTARDMASTFGGTAYPISELPRLLASADVLISATGATDYMIRPDMIGNRSSTPLVLIDIAVPRDIDPGVADIDHVTLHSMDSLNSKLDEGILERQSAIPQVEQIIIEETAHFQKALRSANANPTLSGLHRRADQIRRDELSRMLRNLPDDLDPKLQKQLDKFSRSLVNKLLHTPTSTLRQAAERGESDSYDALVKELFGLNK